MKKLKSTTWEIEPHTEAKHEILKKYWDAWLPILASKFPKVVFIDGFAGPGEYENNQEGSPLIVIKSVLDHKIKITSKIIFLFIEKDKERYKYLENKLKKLKIPKNIIYECECGEFMDVLKEILEDLEKREANLAPTFLFLDPFGFKGIPFKIIKKFMKNSKCELLVNFMIRDVKRFLELSQNEEIYNELFGTEEWKKIQKEPNPKERYNSLHELYKNQLKTIAEFVLSFKMINKFNQTNYYLFFATNHILGLKKMKEVMWKINPMGAFEFSDVNYDPNQTILIEPKPNYNLLKNILVKEFKGKKVNIEELEKFVLTETIFRETHYKTQILRPMENAEEIKINSKNRRKGTYPAGTIIKFL